jgi:hypothetical protein
MSALLRDSTPVGSSLACKYRTWVKVANTPAYYGTELISAINKFMEQALRVYKAIENLMYFL